MTPESWQRVEGLFHTVLRQPPAERQTFLASCVIDDELRREVEALLAADEEAGAFLAEPAILDASRLIGSSLDATAGLASNTPRNALQTAAPAGAGIGPYQILRLLGEGGMSTVYLASRSDLGTTRLVAIKLIKRGMDTGPIHQRFCQEREILSGLEHPNIARLLDGGSTTEGRPYFVMEHVAGVPIDEYCESQDVALETRLALFRSVCAAVDYAHRNLVVHRDIKPSNILVTAEGVPKLLDFGIAKLLTPDSAERSDLTTASQGFWTPHYASPEQVRGRAVTTATDVYSLGVLLYKLLTGERPYSFTVPSPQEIERVVCEAQPIAPSSAMRRTGARYERRLSGDLDTIVLMALRKEPERRYRSAQDLAEDLRRYGEGLPVVAQRNTFRYRFGKFLRRNALGVSAAALVGASLIVGAALAVWQARNATAERRKAEAQRARAEQVLAFLVDVFKQSEPAPARASQLTAREILRAGASRITSELRDQPEVQATLMDTIGVVYQNLGLYAPAEELLKTALERRQHALGDDHPDVALSLGHLASLYAAQYRPEAVTLHRQSLALRRKVLGADNPLVAQSLHDLALSLQHTDSLEVEDLHRQALAIRRRVLGSDHAEVAESLTTLGSWLASRERYPEAEACYAEALAIRRRAFSEDHPAVNETLDGLAILRFKQGRYEDAEPLFRTLLERSRLVKGADHPDTAGAESMLAIMLDGLGRLEESEQLQRQALRKRIAAWGNDHAAVDHSLAWLGVVLLHEARFADAEAVLRRALELRRNRYGQTNRAVADTLVQLGRARLAAGGLDEAEALFEEARRVWRRLMGDRGLGVGDALDGIARVRATRGESMDAIPLFERALEIRRAVLGPSPRVADTLVGLATAACGRDLPRAETAFREALQIRAAAYPRGHWEIAETESLLGACLSAHGHEHEARPLLKRSAAALRARLGAQHPLTRAALQRLPE